MFLMKFNWIGDRLLTPLAKMVQKVRRKLSKKLILRKTSDHPFSRLSLQKERIIIGLIQSISDFLALLILTRRYVAMSSSLTQRLVSSA